MKPGEMATRKQSGAGEPAWRLWARQIGILVRQELHGSLFTRRRLWVYLMAFAPVLIVAIHWVMSSSQPADPDMMEQNTQVFAGIMEFYYVRLALFFACMSVFTWLFRGEMVERTLHYPFLTAVRREVLVIGKFLGGAAVVICVFETAVLACFYFLYSRFGSAGSAYVFHGDGLKQLGAYLLIVALGTLGYGSVFLGLSLVLRNPIVAGALFFGWEAATPVMPGWLQMLSVTFYLKHLFPVSLPGTRSVVLALLTVTTQSISTYTAVAGLLCFTAAVLAFACYKIRKTEITYTSD
ncbi:MAG: ABC transporter permease subunit [Acidobacteriota bacterium]|nr:ABC transporter permease subunit [Acidobacteriota bacterium]